MWIAVLALTAAALAVGWRISTLQARREALRTVELKRIAHAELAGAQSRQSQLQELLDGAGVGVLAVGSTGAIEMANAEVAAMLGIPLEELSGKTPIELFLSAELHEAVRSILEGGERQAVELREIGPQSLALEVEVRPRGAAPDRSAVLFAHDVTEFRRLETVRRDFVANVSHELRTPLASIRAMAETLQSGALADESVSERFLGAIVEESDRLARIAEDLLSLTEAERREPRKSSFSLSKLLEDIVLRFQPRADLEGISLSGNIDEGLKVKADRDLIEQAVLNLVDNAIKYSSSGDSVVIAASQRGEDLEVAVSDTGIGLLQEDVPRVFERFYRVDKARSRRSGGTGLGLSIVKNVVAAHGGRVSVNSEYNHGSTFTISLPTANVDSKVPAMERRR